MNKFGMEKDAVVLVPVNGKASVWRPWNEVEGRNGNLAKWMKGEGYQLYIAMGLTSETWRRAIAEVCEHHVYLTNHSGFVEQMKEIALTKEEQKAIEEHGDEAVEISVAFWGISKIVAKAPWDTFKPTKCPAPVRNIEAKGLEARCSYLNISIQDKKKIAANIDAVKGTGLIFSKAVDYSMEFSISMDIETASVANTGGRFLTYAIGYRYMSEKVRIVAETVADLRGGLMWKALQEWDRRAEEVIDRAKDEWSEKMLEWCKQGKVGAKPKHPPNCMYIYAYNGSRFDHIDCIHNILAHDDEVPCDQLESNGKFISFKWKHLVFRDACLITMSSLSSACKAFGIPTEKGSLPHRYLQNCASEDDILSRIHGRVTWGQLEPYMDWFSEAGDSELHHRKAGRTYEDWIGQQPLRKFWLERKDTQFSFKDEMCSYLEKDVDALWELCEKLGYKFAEEFGADIRTKCTLGSCVEHIWCHTLLKPIPKLATKKQHDLWQAANRGGFCGALGKFDFSVKGMPGEWKIYKIDIASQYPAAAGPITYETVEGVQSPIGEWYKSFPDPTNDWFQKDFGGVLMTDEHYDLLENMHGILKIEFDQRHLKFPFFLKKMQYKQMETLAPVMVGSESYTTPHVRMAYKHGVKIKLHFCEYAKETREVYGEYMGHFAQVKNDADAVIKSLGQTYDKIEFHLWSEEDQNSCIKATYERTIAKLFLNGLLGRNNMKLDRMQTMITRDPNDVTCIRADKQSFRNAQVEDITCGGKWAYKARFKEGSYDYHIHKSLTSAHTCLHTCWDTARC